MSVIVTGAAGFMGSHLVRYLIGKGQRVLGIDNLSGGFLSNLSDEAKKHFWKKDLADRDLSLQRFNLEVGLGFYDQEYDGFDVAFHLAADATEGRSQFHPLSCTYDNYVASLNFFKACIKIGVRRIVFCSSMSVYGAQHPPFDESLPRMPEDIYAISKASTERSLEILSEVHGFEYVIVRPHNVYGPLQNASDPYRNVIAIWMNALLRDRPLYVYGDGTQRRAFSYVDDITPCLAACGELPLHREIINLGAEKDYSLNQLSNILLELAKHGTVRHLPGRPKEVHLAWATVEKSKRLLNFVDATPFSEGLGRMWKWFSETYPHGVEPRYLDHLELPNDMTPATWRDRLY